jgi:c-di-GMP-binding flagellar brake protein YcgR
VADLVDKRKHHRFLALLKVHVQPGDQVPPDLALTTVDIAVGGARCASNRRLLEKVILKLTFTLEGGDLRQPFPIELDAMVLRCSEKSRTNERHRYDVALQFVRMDPQDRIRLQNYLNSL